MEDYRSRVLINGVTTGDLQKKSLEMFKYFKQICQENGLRYWAGGGTCIGALRHQGFIPWDDDLDVFMPRSDYWKLREIWNQVADTKQYQLLYTDKTRNGHDTCMRMVDLNTTFINRSCVNEDIEHGMFIDIISMEGCPESKWSQLWQIYHSVLYSVYNVQRLPDNQGKLLRFATQVALGLVRTPEQRYKVWTRHEKKMAKYDFDQAKLVKETTTSFRALFYAYPRAYFETKEVPFEDTTIAIPLGAHEYLTRIFGDYMALPPEEKRVAKHNIVFIDLHKPYTEYKGIYYCVNDGK